MLRVAIFVATSLLVGCPSKQPEAPRAPEDAALRVRIAQAEARRAGGIDELAQLASSSDVHARELALRGLGRSGGDKALATLEAAVGDREPRVVVAALGAIGVAASLDDLSPEIQARLGATVIATLQRDVQYAPAALEALGRAGDAAVQTALVTQLGDRDPAIASAAAIALGRHGRRKIAWSAEARAALAKATAHADASVRYAATYALSREHEPPADDAVTAALIARIPDDNPETRAQAIAGLAKRKGVAAARKPIEESLRDRDWRVAVEAVRALAGSSGDEQGRAAVVASLSVRAAELSQGNATEAHVISEALRALLDHPLSQPLVLNVAAASPLARGWIECLAAAASKSSAGVTAIVDCGGGGLPDHLRLPLLADVAKNADADYKRAALRVLLAHDDPRVRAAGLGLLPSTWKDADARGQATIIGTVSSALAVKSPIVAGTAVDVAGELYESMPADHPHKATLDAAILGRAKAETDVELSASLYALIGKRALPGGADVCRAGLAGAPARAKAAADCLKALGEAAPELPSSATEVPALDVASVIGKKLYWHLQTSRGDVVVELRPDIAPWAVASIVALTSRGFYDGLEFHRVVPNFVVQGGDPTMSGWGGPGYALPAEPATGADASGYVAGGVGMADAGRDSAGSQWFIMHSRAPHLDGRYTWIGTVASGQKSADALLIGDRVVKATIEQR